LCCSEASLPVRRARGCGWIEGGSCMSELRRRIDEAADVVRKKVNAKPTVAIILGTGLGGVAKEIGRQERIPYAEIPGFAKPTVATHAGEMVFGELSGKPVVVMEGRFHYYEGHSMADVTFPVRVARALGATHLIVSNAAGGLSPQFDAGDIMIIEDHINLMGENPLVGPNDDELGPRFPDMFEPYDREMLRLAEEAALREGIRAHRGVYAALTGPCLETRAEYRFLRAIGADAVGMSTVPEVIVAVHAGFKTLGLSCITDNCTPERLKPVKIAEIIAIATRAEPKLTKIVTEVVAKL